MRLKSWRVKKIPCAQSRLLAHSGPLPVALCQCQCHTIDTNHTKLTMVKLCNIFGRQANFSLNESTNQEMQFEGDKWLEKWNQFKISEGQKYETSLPDCFLRRMLHKGRKVDHCTNFITFNNPFDLFSFKSSPSSFFLLEKRGGGALSKMLITKLLLLQGITRGECWTFTN